MKKRSLISLVFIFAFILIGGCNSSVDNSITFNNMATQQIIVNFRGQDYVIPSNQSVVVKEIDKGTYTYATSYSLPSISIFNILFLVIEIMKTF